MTKRFVLCLLAVVTVFSACSFALADVSPAPEPQEFTGEFLSSEDIEDILAGKVVYSNVTVSFVDEETAMREYIATMSAEEPVTINTDSHNSVKICPTCGAYGTVEGSRTYDIQVVGTKECCYIHYTYVQQRCTGPEHHVLYVEKLTDVIAAHKWGPLNNDQYTHTCTLCGYTDKA